MFCDFRTNLSGIPIDSLTAAEDQIRNAEMFDGVGHSCGSSQGVSAAESSVADQFGFISTHCQAVSQDGFSMGRSHGDDGDMGTQFIFQLQSRFQSILVIGVHNIGYTISDEVVGNRIDLHFSGIRHLFNTYNDVHYKATS